MKKKWIIIVSLVMLAVILLGAFAAPEIISRRETLGISLQVTNATATKATLLCTRGIGFVAGSVQTGRSYYLERQTANGWEQVQDPRGDNVAWPMDAQLVPLGISQVKLNYGDIYGELTPGTYRLCKRYFTQPMLLGKGQSALLYAQFEIK